VAARERGGDDLLGAPLERGPRRVGGCERVERPGHLLPVHVADAVLLATVVGVEHSAAARIEQVRHHPDRP
jgi:hypothetical protein